MIRKLILALFMVLVVVLAYGAVGAPAVAMNQPSLSEQPPSLRFHHGLPYPQPRFPGRT